MRGSTDVGIVGCLAVPEVDEDWPLLRAELASLGVRATFVAWDDPSVDWGAFASHVIRASWDSTLRPVEYLAWVGRVEAASTLHNAPDVVRWNLDKRYLADLEDVGLPIVPTTWIAPTDSWELPADGRDHVLKPTISGGGMDTARYRSGQGDTAQVHLRELQAAGRTVMAQPYIDVVDDQGEIAIIFFSGAYSHSVRKGAWLERDAGVVYGLWEGEVITRVDPLVRQMAVAEGTVAHLVERFGIAPLYCRVDIIGGITTEPMILEVELIDPSLFLTHAPGSPARLAEAIVARL